MRETAFFVTVSGYRFHFLYDQIVACATTTMERGLVLAGYQHFHLSPFLPFFLSFKVDITFPYKTINFAHAAIY